MKIAPGPHRRFGLSLIPGVFTEKGQRRMERYADDARRYGDVVRYQMGPIVLHLLRCPDHAKHLLQENHAGYGKGRGLVKLKVLLGDGLLTSEGELWRRQRRLTQPAFHRQRLAGLAKTMVDVCADALDRWASFADTGEAVNILEETMRLTLVIAAKTLFSVNVTHEADAVGRALTTVLQESSRRIFQLVSLPDWVPVRSNVDYRTAREALDRVVYDILATRRRSKEPHADLLGMLLEAKDEETGESMSDKQLRDETMTLFLAGHETTANLLAWTAYLLSKSPDVARKLEREVDEALGGRAPRFEDLPSLKYTRMVIDESLRLYPPAWIVGRQALADDEIGGYHIPKGSLVAAVIYLTHRHPSHWQNPEGFDPERFSPEASAARHKHAYMPFGAGPRVCIGNQFALMEGTLCLAMIAQRYRLELAAGARVEMEPVVTLRPLGGMPMLVRKREPATKAQYVAPTS